MGHEVHAGQRYGHLPYSVHLDAVADVLREFGHGDDPSSMSAAYLHDAIEDQGVTREQIAERFGERVADIVDAVSDPPGADRNARKAAAYPRIRELDDAVTVKLADRIANVQAGGPLREMYRASRRRSARTCARQVSPTTCGRTSTRCWSADQLGGRCCGMTYSR